MLLSYLTADLKVSVDLEELRHVITLKKWIKIHSIINLTWKCTKFNKIVLKFKKKKTIVSYLSAMVKASTIYFLSDDASLLTNILFKIFILPSYSNQIILKKFGSLIQVLPLHLCLPSFLLSSYPPPLYSSYLLFHLLLPYLISIS